MKEKLFQDLLESVKQAGEIKRGELEPARANLVKNSGMPDTLAIRESMTLSRAQFAYLLGVPVRTVEGWEQGRRKPTGSARTLLLVAAKHPKIVLETVQESLSK